jgi:ribokinase
MERARDASFLMPNETELAILTRLPVESEAEVAAAAQTLVGRGFEAVIVTLGARGALIATHEGGRRIAPVKVEAIDTTGAGDAFIGSFAVFLAEGLPEREALKRANLYAALSTTQVGTQKSFPTRAQFDSEWRKRGAAP